MSVSLYFEGDKNAIDAPNMSNRNARDVFAYLGVEFDYCGSIAVDELIERCSVSLAVLASGVVDKGAIETVQHGNVIECGRDEDYMERRINEILLYAKDAKRSGASCVTWG